MRYPSVLPFFLFYILDNLSPLKIKTTWNKCVKVDMRRFCLVKDDAHNRDKWRSLTTGNRPTLPQCGNEDVILYGLRSRDVKR